MAVRARIGVADIAVIVVVAVIAVLLTHRYGPNPSPPAPARTTPEQLDGILLDPADIYAVMGRSTMQVMTSERMETASPPRSR